MAGRSCSELGTFQKFFFWVLGWRGGNKVVGGFFLLVGAR